MGSDKRIGYLKEKLKQENIHFDSLLSNEQCNQALHSKKTIILPLPASDNNGNINTVEGSLSEQQFSELVKEGSLVIGGKLSQSLRDFLDKKNIQWFDYFDCEELTILNAMVTAEGAISIILSTMPTTLFGSTVLITGYGRISRCMVKILRGFGAKEIIVAARSPKDRQWAAIDGARAIEIGAIYKNIENVDLVINTVPYLIFSEDLLWLLKKNCFLLDLASVPGGIDFKAAQTLGVNVKWALGLPSKSASKTAGEGIFDTIKHLLKKI